MDGFSWVRRNASKTYHRLWAGDGPGSGEPPAAEEASEEIYAQFTNGLIPITHSDQNIPVLQYVVTEEGTHSDAKSYNLLLADFLVKSDGLTPASTKISERIRGQGVVSRIGICTGLMVEIVLKASTMQHEVLSSMSTLKLDEKALEESEVNAAEAGMSDEDRKVLKGFLKENGHDSLWDYLMLEQSEQFEMVPSFTIFPSMKDFDVFVDGKLSERHHQELRKVAQFIKRGRQMQASPEFPPVFLLGIAVELAPVPGVTQLDMVLALQASSYAYGVSLPQVQPTRGHLTTSEIKLSDQTEEGGITVAKKHVGGIEKWIFAFRGTSNASEVMTDLQTQLKSIPELAGEDKGAVQVHSGFLETSMRLFPIDIVRLLYETSQSQQVQFIFCGHSLGGAVAAITAMRVASRCPELLEKGAIKSVSFGAPWFINEAGKAYFQKYENLFLCIRDNSDVVPRLLATKEYRAEVTEIIREQARAMAEKAGTGFLEVLLDGSRVLSWGGNLVNKLQDKIASPYVDFGKLIAFSGDKQEWQRREALKVTSHYLTSYAHNMSEYAGEGCRLGETGTNWITTKIGTIPLPAAKAEGLKTSARICQNNGGSTQFDLGNVPLFLKRLEVRGGKETHTYGLKELYESTVVMRGTSAVSTSFDREHLRWNLQFCCNDPFSWEDGVTLTVIATCRGDTEPSCVHNVPFRRLEPGGGPGGSAAMRAMSLFRASMLTSVLIQIEDAKVSRTPVRRIQGAGKELTYKEFAEDNKDMSRESRDAEWVKLQIVKDSLKYKAGKLSGGRTKDAVLEDLGLPPVEVVLQEWCSLLSTFPFDKSSDAYKGFLQKNGKKTPANFMEDVTKELLGYLEKNGEKAVVSLDTAAGTVSLSNAIQMYLTAVEHVALVINGGTYKVEHPTEITSAGSKAELSLKVATTAVMAIIGVGVALFAAGAAGGVAFHACAALGGPVSVVGYAELIGGVTSSAAYAARIYDCMWAQTAVVNDLLFGETYKRLCEAVNLRGYSGVDGREASVLDYQREAHDSVFKDCKCFSVDAFREKAEKDFGTGKSNVIAFLAFGEFAYRMAKHTMKKTYVIVSGLKNAGKSTLIAEVFDLGQERDDPRYMGSGMGTSIPCIYFDGNAVIVDCPGLGEALVKSAEKQKEKDSAQTTEDWSARTWLRQVSCLHCLPESHALFLVAQSELLRDTTTEYLRMTKDFQENSTLVITQCDQRTSGGRPAVASIFKDTLHLSDERQWNPEILRDMTISQLINSKSSEGGVDDSSFTGEVIYCGIGKTSVQGDEWTSPHTGILDGTNIERRLRERLKLGQKLGAGYSG